ncbi:3-keto-5-aminohexanoate cleavage protein [Saccharopolyspora sp. MS10]|uniref:3-keto-5-aminohexanoate cleavage protein n=1 Tax=Saccharopolyspora sp. MS10 TaxID=3385973 RepID=UPI0039A227A5
MTLSPEPTGTILAVAPDPGAVSGPDAIEGVVRSAAGCARVGAALVDVSPLPGVPLSALVAAVRERTGLLVRATADSAAELSDCGADALCCSLDAPAEVLREVRDGARDRGAAPHLLARTAAELARLRELPAPAHVLLLLGTPEGLPGTVPAFASAMELVPAGTGLTAAGVGAAGVPVLLTALAAGAHVRIGRADTPDYAPGTPARDDAQLVARAAGVAKIAQRPPLPPERAAAALGIKT